MLNYIHIHKNVKLNNIITIYKLYYHHKEYKF